MAKKKTDDLSRRDVLKGAGALAGTAAVGCNSGSDSSDSGGSLTKGDDPNEGTEGARLECESTSTLTTSELLAPINNIVVVMMENRSFDHYFGALSLEEGRMDVDGLTGEEFNPGPDGQPILTHRQTNPFVCPPPHKWDAMHEAFNDGRLDGFVTEHEKANEDTPGCGSQVMGYLTRDDIPIHYAMADNYTLFDRWHCSLLGPTWPNRFYMHAASSGGRKSNFPRPFLTTVWDVLDDADLRGINYFSDIPWAAGGLLKIFGFDGIDDFFEDAARGRLPDFSILDPGFFTSSDHPGFGGESEHPGMGPNLQLGQLFLATVYSALAASPQWKSTLLLITYDENGGFYDHVSPPEVTDSRADFRRLGFRVPTLAIGPHVRRGCVNNNLLEHSSIMATIQRRWNLEVVNDRVAEANDISSAINPEYIGNPQNPVKLPDFEVDPGMLMDNLVPDPEGAPELWQMAENGQIPRHLDRRFEHQQYLNLLLNKGREYDLFRDRIKWGKPRRK